MFCFRKSLLSQFSDIVFAEKFSDWWQYNDSSGKNQAKEKKISEFSKKSYLRGNFKSLQKCLQILAVI